MSADPTRLDLRTDPLTRRMSGVTAHGLIPFDVPFMSEIAPNLWQGGCAASLVLPAHVEHLVSLYPWESYEVRHELASAVSVVMHDSLDQDTSAIRALAGWVNACRRSGPVLVHCQAGLNRSSLVVATALMLEGLTAGAAISLIRDKRSPACLCNPAFEEWLVGTIITPRLLLADYKRVYTRRGKRAHLSAPFGMFRDVLCPVQPGAPDQWLGTGDQAEYERAASLPLCRDCKSAFGAALAEAS